MTTLDRPGTHHPTAVRAWVALALTPMGFVVAAVLALLLDVRAGPSFAGLLAASLVAAAGMAAPAAGVLLADVARRAGAPDGLLAVLVSWAVLAGMAAALLLLVGTHVGVAAIVIGVLVLAAQLLLAAR